MYMRICICMCVYVYVHACHVTCLLQKQRNSDAYEHVRNAILIIFEGQLQVFQRFSSSKLVPKTVESCFVALNYYENGSSCE